MTSMQQQANAIRFLAMDAVEKAQSGHPGMPMGMADVATVLWQKYLSHNPNNPSWLNRDRFVLSNGHGAMLQYALLHLTGYDVSIEDIKQFRQLDSKTPGHPEFGDTPGVETTTGPLGQGLANAVGFALAERLLAATFNRAQHALIDHYTYAVVGDGCLMEGISHEVSALAGTWQLNKLIVFWDDNGISIDGEVDNWFTTDVAQQYRAYGWQVIEAIDGHDYAAIDQAIQKARGNRHQPSLIICKTIIGHGAPNKAGDASTHGAALGEEEVQAARHKLDWPYQPFEIPSEIYQAWEATDNGEKLENAWLDLWQDYQRQYPQLSQELMRRLNQQLPEDWDALMQKMLVESQQQSEPIATRKASGQVIEKMAKKLPELVGGSADLSGSNVTNWPQAKVLTSDRGGANYIHYGVREFGMAAIMNGMALNGGLIPFGGTFLVFQTYMANAVRMSALMRQRVIYVYTHDSIGLGEDGPTHQPVAEANTLRMTPNLETWRPCDYTETIVAWRCAIEHQTGPTALLLSRQKLPRQKRDAEMLKTIDRGGYILWQTPGDHLDIILIATGSEVALAQQTARVLKEQQYGVRVVSMPCCERFLKQSNEYQSYVLPESCRHRLVIEAGASAYWYRFAGLDGDVLGLDRFGASAPSNDVFTECGFTVEKVLALAQSMLVNQSK